MKVNKRSVISIGCLLLIVVCLFPPWKKLEHYSLNQNVSIEKNLSYSFLISPPKLDKQDHLFTSIKIDWERHIILIAIIILLFLIILNLIGDKEINTSEIQNKLSNIFSGKENFTNNKKECDLTTAIESPAERQFLIPKHEKYGNKITVDNLREMIYAGIIKETDVCIEEYSNKTFIIKDILEYDKGRHEIEPAIPISKPVIEIKTSKNITPENELLKKIRKHPWVTSAVAISLILDITGVINIGLNPQDKEFIFAPLSTLLVVYSIGIAAFIKSKCNYRFSKGGAFIYCIGMYVFWIFIHLIYSNDVYKPSLLFWFCFFATYRIIKSDETLKNSVYSKILNTTNNLFFISAYLFISGISNLIYFFKRSYPDISFFSWSIVLFLIISSIFYLFTGIIRKKHDVN